MNARKSIIVAALVAVLVGIFAFLRVRETMSADGRDAGPSSASGKPSSSSTDSPAGPVKSKVERSRELNAPSPEEVEAAAARTRRAIGNARQIGLGLFEFESEFGSFPNEATADAVQQSSGTKERLGAATANDCFRQLMAADIVEAASIFTWDEAAPDPAAANLKKCGFAYLSGMTSAGNPRRPLVVAPLVPGTLSFDRKAFGGKAVILRVDNSVSTWPIEVDGTVRIDGMDLFDPAQPYWGGKVPVIKWPEE